ncbi:hypothetical protein AFLA_003028 [Aspergillus flavus NRRL3357]|nr:hypothetical protein AFLA_003028 [Aspergillus flavus NRRL3357]
MDPSKRIFFTPFLDIPHRGLESTCAREIVSVKVNQQLHLSYLGLQEENAGLRIQLFKSEAAGPSNRSSTSLLPDTYLKDRKTKSTGDCSNTLTSLWLAIYFGFITVYLLRTTSDLIHNRTSRLKSNSTAS